MIPNLYSWEHLRFKPFKPSLKKKNTPNKLAFPFLVPKETVEQSSNKIDFQKVNFAVSFRECTGLWMMNQTHRIHVWYIYLHEWLIFMVNVGKYTIHGSYGKQTFYFGFHWLDLKKQKTYACLGVQNVDMFSSTKTLVFQTYLLRFGVLGMFLGPNDTSSRGWCLEA